MSGYSIRCYKGLRYFWGSSTLYKSMTVHYGLEWPISMHTLHPEAYFIVSKILYLMRFTIEMLYSVTMKYTEGKAWLWIDFLRILHHMCLLLNSFEFTEQNFRCVNQFSISSFSEYFFVFFSYQIVINTVINR